MMKRVFKKALSVLLCTAVLATMAACGSTKKKTEETNATNTTTEESTVEEATTEEAASTEESTVEADTTSKLNAYFEKYPAFDMGGRTIKIGMFWDAFYDSNDTKPEDNPSVSNLEVAQARLDNIRRIEKKYNCKIEYVNPGSDALIDSLNTSVVAGTPDYDIYLTQLSFGLPLAVNGYFNNISDLSTDYEDINNNQSILTQHEIAGTNCFLSTTGLQIASNYMVYNADMLENLGLEDPNELYKKGEWTWEKFEELTKAATKDTDSDGTTDIYGYGGDLTLTLTEFLASNNAKLVSDDGKQLLEDPKTVETYKFLAKLYNDDNAGRPLSDDWNDNIYAWTQGKAVFAPTQMWILQTTPVDFNYRIVPWPVGPSGDGSQAGQSFGDYYVIPKGVKEADKVYQIFEEFMGWFGADTDFRDGDDMELVEGCFVDENDIKTSLTIGAKGNGDLWPVIDTNYIVNGIFGSVVTEKSKTVSQAIESSKQLFQDEIDAIMKPSK